MRAIPLALLVVLPSCLPSPDAGRRGAAVRRPASPPPPPMQAVASAMLPSPDAWLLRADSVMGVELERDLFLSAAGHPAGIQDCADDDGSDDPPLLTVAVATRIVGRSPAIADSMMEVGNVVLRSTYRVAVTSVATLVPYAMTASSASNGPADERTYTGRIGRRVDTFDIKMAELLRRRGDEPELAPLPPGPHWVVCEPTLPARAGEAAALWSFAHETPRWMEVRTWTPADGSWERVVALAGRGKN